MKRPFKGVFVILAALALAVPACSRDFQAGDDPATPDVPPIVTTAPARTAVARVSPGVGSTAPDFTLADLQGNRLSLSGLRGRPVMLNFWATT